jgi:hypothetical protein
LFRSAVEDNENPIEVDAACAGDDGMLSVVLVEVGRRIVAGEAVFGARRSAW